MSGSTHYLVWRAADRAFVFRRSGESWKISQKSKLTGKSDISYLPREIATKLIILKILASPDHSEQNWKKSASNIYRRKYQRNRSFSKFWQVLIIPNKTGKSRRRIFTEGNTNEIDHFQNSGKYRPFRTKLKKVGIEYLPKEIPTKLIISKFWQVQTISNKTDLEVENDCGFNFGAPA